MQITEALISEPGDIRRFVQQALEFFNLLHGSSKFRGRNDLFSCGHSSKTSLLVLLAPEK
ncbi:hypothetical protein B9N30_10710 [Escherichia coli]|nr:hypothetical protein B9N30_10710 [Escherichia coli]